MADEGSDTLVCSRYDPFAPRIEGSKILVCAECEHAIEVAPSGQRFAAKTGARMICVLCGIKVMKADEDIEVLSPTPEQIAELRQHLRGTDGG
jgi:hypothetical protein